MYEPQTRSYAAYSLTPRVESILSKQFNNVVVRRKVFRGILGKKSYVRRGCGHEIYEVRGVRKGQTRTYVINEQTQSESMRAINSIPVHINYKKESAGGQ